MRRAPRLTTALLLALSPAPLLAQSREDVVFQLQHDLSARPDLAVYVQGDLPELGGGEIPEAVKLQSPDGVSWWVTVSLPVNRTYEFRYVERDRREQHAADPRNGRRLSDWTTASTSTVEVGGKTVLAHTRMDDPVLRWRYEGEDVPYRKRRMHVFGPGRTDAERRWIAPSLGGTGRTLEFFLKSGTDPSQRDPASGVYRTPAEEVLLQDGALFTYVPAADVSLSRRDYDPAAPPAISSGILGTDRPYRVFLPRGYDDHPERRYPVLYHYDGQVIWDLGNVSWDKDGKGMRKNVRKGLVGEVIQVGVDYLGFAGCTVQENRFRDCASPEDTYTCINTVSGEGDLFQAFLSNELKPLIDATYRTLPDREHTFAHGYSFGGIFAMYAGWENPHTFGAVAPQSASFWVPNFPARIKTEPKKDIRIYIDTGDDELSIYDSVQSLRDNLVGKAVPYVEEGDLRFEVGFQQIHGFDKGGKRLRAMMTFLYPSTSEPPDFFVGDRYCATVANSTGETAMLFVEGSAVLADDDLALTATRVPRGTFGRFLVGTSAVSLPGFHGGVGVQCAGGTITAFDVVSTGPDGVLRDAPSLTGLFAPGQTAYVQAWFRDGVTSNTSDAVALALE